MMTPDQLAAELARGLDGPHADEHTAGAAKVAAQAVRFLNYATGSHSAEGLTYPATVYTIAGSLSAAARGLPQLCDQLTAWLYAQEAAGHLANDDRTAPGITVALAADRLDRAAQLAGRLGDELAALQSVISGLNGRGGAR
jgi:hypothetical protein